MSFSLPVTGEKLFRGDTIVIEFAVNQGGVPTNLTGYSIWFTMKTNITNTDSNSSTIQKTLTNGITILDAAAGTLKVVIAPNDTATINAETTYVCDLQIKSSGGDISTVADGTIKISMDVTQNTT